MPSLQTSPSCSICQANPVCWWALIIVSLVAQKVEETNSIVMIDDDSASVAKSVLVPAVADGCWSGGFTREFCCASSLGAEGNQLCWDGGYTFERCCGHFATMWPHDRVSEHPLLLPPSLCPSSALPAIARNYTALNFCPPVRVEYFRREMVHLTGSVPSDYWMLDAPAVLAIIRTVAPLSFRVVNLGAKPSKGAAYEDGDRRPARGDDSTVLFFMGFQGVNFDISEQEKMMLDYYPLFGPGVLVDTSSVMPTRFVEALHSYRVPKDIDFLKVDVDSFDCEFITEMLAEGFRPKVIDVELSVLWPPPLKFSLKYTPETTYTYTDAMMTALSGCSLQYAVDSFKNHGYELIQYQLQDGWFVRQEFVGLFGDIERNPSSLYQIGNPNMYDGMARFDWAKTQQELVALTDVPDQMLAHAKQALKAMIHEQGLDFVKYELTL